MSRDHFHSERLAFRRPTAEDGGFWHNYLSDPDRTRFLRLGRPYTADEADTYLERRFEHWREHGFGTYVLSKRGSDTPIGYCGLEYFDGAHVDVRYGLMQSAWGRGLAHEAAVRCVRLGFESLDLVEIYGVALPGNGASIAILKRLGMTPTQELDVYGDEVQYFVLRREDLTGKEGTLGEAIL